MAQVPSRPISGHVYRRGDRSPSWYAKYRLPDGRQVNRKIGPVWTGRGRPAEGYFTKRTAEAWLEDLLIEARRGTLPGLVRTGATFETASAEWLRYCEVDRQLRHSTIQHYTQMAARLNETFGQRRVEDITSDEIEGYLASMKGVANDTRLKYYTAFSGIFKRARRVHKLRYDPMHDVERPGQGGRPASTSSRSRRYMPSRGRRSPRMTRHCSSPRLSPVFAKASSWPSAGARLISVAMRSAWRGASRTAARGHPSQDGVEPYLWSRRSRNALPDSRPADSQRTRETSSSRRHRGASRTRPRFLGDTRLRWPPPRSIVPSGSTT